MSDGSAAWDGLAVVGANVNVVAGESGSVRVEARLDVDGVEATAREVSVTNVNCEFTDGVDVSRCDVVKFVVGIGVGVTDGRLITVPFEVVVAFTEPDVIVELAVVMVELPPLEMVVALPETLVIVVPFPEMVDVMVLLPLVIVVTVTVLDVVPLPGAEVMVELG